MARKSRISLFRPANKNLTQKTTENLHFTIPNLVRSRYNKPTTSLRHNIITKKRTQGGARFTSATAHSSLSAHAH